VLATECAARLRALDDDAVALNAQRVHREDCRLTSVAERRQEDPDVVVGIDLVAIGERGLDGAGLRERANAEVDRGCRVPDEHLGRVERRPTVHGRVLREAGKHRCSAPYCLIEASIDNDLRFDARRCNLELALSPAEALAWQVVKRNEGEEGDEERGDHRGLRRGGVLGGA
jgi:hypothetical protein